MMLKTLSSFKQMPLKGKLLSLLTLVFILSVTSLTVYQVREKQKYEGKAETYYTYYGCSAPAGTTAQCVEVGPYISADICERALRFFPETYPDSTCYTTANCDGHCAGTATSTPTPTVPPGGQKMYYCKSDTPTCIETSGFYTDTSLCSANVKQWGQKPNTGACWPEELSCQDACKAGQQMYVCNTETGECIGTTNLYTDVDVCRDNVRKYITYPNTDTCYTSVSSCQTACGIAPKASTPTPKPKGSTPVSTPAPKRTLKGDLNGDGCVNSLDLGIIIDNYNPSAPVPRGSLKGDLNGDGYINSIDLGILIDNYNPTAPSCQ